MQGRGPAASVPVEGVPVRAACQGMPVESTPLVGEEVPLSGAATAVGVPVTGQSSMEGAAEALRENKEKGSACGSASCGFLGGIMCLLVYYLNDGAHAECSRPLPLFLKVNGFGGLAMLLAAGCLTGALSGSTQNVGIKALLGLVGALVGGLSCFLFAWLIMGVVWFVETSPSECDGGVYEGTKWYFILVLLVPLSICCCACCCAFGIFCVKARESARNAPAGDPGPSAPSVAV